MQMIFENNFDFNSKLFNIKLDTNLVWQLEKAKLHV